MEKPKKLFTFMKKADKKLNRVLIPKFIIDNYGREFLLEVYDNGDILLKPTKK